MKIAIDLTAYEILLLRAALFTASDGTGVLDMTDTVPLSQRLFKNSERFPVAELKAAKTILQARYGEKDQA